MPLPLAGEVLDDLRVRLYGHNGKPLLLGGPAGDQLQVVAVNPDGTTIGGRNTTLQLLAPGTRSGTTWSADQSNPTARGVILYLDVTARTVGASPTINLRIQAKGPMGGRYQNLFISSNFDPSLNLIMVVYYPGITSVDSQVGTGFYAGTPLPLTWRAGVVFNADVTDLTYSFDACYIY